MREKPLLLLIDDELGLVESLTVLLEDEGFEVVSALSGAGGIESRNEPAGGLADERSELQG